jgi:hypothetical protein
MGSAAWREQDQGRIKVFFAAHKFLISGFTRSLNQRVRA